MNQLLKLFIGEFIGVFILIFVGNGIVSGFVYKKGAAKNDSFLTIILTWSLAVVVAIVISNAFHGQGIINPAFSIFKFISDKEFLVNSFLISILAQFLGAIFGQIVLDIMFWNHIIDPENRDKILVAHATVATHQNKHINNFMSEFLGSIILFLGIQAIGNFDKQIVPIYIGFLIFVIGASTGSITGFALNPARDLGPRLVYSFLPIKNKTSANWTYSLIPLLAPILAGLLAAGITKLEYINPDWFQ